MTLNFVNIIIIIGSHSSEKRDHSTGSGWGMNFKSSVVQMIEAVFAPAKVNWASGRMYNTHKRGILYVLYYGLILGVCGLLNTLCSKQWIEE